MCQVRVFLAVVVGLAAARLIALHFGLPPAPLAIAGLLVGWLGGNVANKTIFAGRRAVAS
jgi:hypothetical protein